MGARPVKLDHTALTQALGADRVPKALSREGRVLLLGEAFAALLENRLPSREAALFLGGAGKAWLTNGGDLSRDHLKVIKPKSKRTAAAIWRELNEARHPDDGQVEEEHSS